jgi:hypothetical protein
MSAMRAGNRLTSAFATCKIVRAIWEERLEEVAAFIEEHDRVPAHHAISSKERSAAKWICVQQSSLKTSAMLPERVASWTKVAKIIATYQCPDKAWLALRDSVVLHITKTGRLPSHTALGRSKEKQAASWIGTQRKHVKANSLSHNRAVAWNELVTTYSDLKIDDKWIAMRDKTILFFKNNFGRLPTCSKGGEEKQLITWVRNQRKLLKNNSLTPSRVAMWTDFVADYAQLQSRTIWLTKRDEVAAFIEEFKKLPTPTLNKQLASWIGTQKQDLRSKKMPPERAAAWSQFVANYSGHFCQQDHGMQWLIHRDEVVSYIKQHNQLPPFSAAYGTKLKQLASWSSTQKQDLKNGKMPPERVILWNELVTKYPDLLGDRRPNKKQKRAIPVDVVPTVGKRKSVEDGLDDDAVVKRRRVSSELSLLNQRYKVMNSGALHRHFAKHVEDWTAYHAICAERNALYPPADIPCNMVIASLDLLPANAPCKTVLDLGCGTGELGAHFRHDLRFAIVQLDHVAPPNSNVVRCDITHLPLPDNVADLAVLCLAMWGSTCKDIVAEAHRTLKPGGTLHLVEPTKRWSNETEEGAPLTASKLVDLLTLNDRFTIHSKRVGRFVYIECTANKL